MILALRTDSPEASVSLLSPEGSELSTHTWVAHRTLARDLLSVIHTQLHERGSDWKDLSGVVIYKGPGSFTGLRISAAVANTIAHTEKIPIVGSNGDGWRSEGYLRLKQGDDDGLVMPEYGSDARITQPRK